MKFNYFNQYFPIYNLKFFNHTQNSIILIYCSKIEFIHLFIIIYFQFDLSLIHIIPILSKNFKIIEFIVLIFLLIFNFQFGFSQVLYLFFQILKNLY